MLPTRVTPSHPTGNFDEISTNRINYDLTKVNYAILSNWAVKGFSDTLNKSHYQNNSDAEIPTVSAAPVEAFRQSVTINELGDITAELMKEVCHDVGTEPSLQPVTEEQLHYRTSNREDGARLDVAATNFWGKDRQRAFFDVRVFNPFAPTHSHTPLDKC